MTHEDVADLLLLDQRIIDRKRGASGISENVLNALIRERFYDHLSAGHLLWHLTHSSSRSPAPGQQKRAPTGTLAARTTDRGDSKEPPRRCATLR